MRGAVDTLGPDVAHVHPDDNDGLRSEHGELGAGAVPWSEAAPFLRALDGMVSLEVLGRRDPEGAVLWSKRFLEALLANSGAGGND